MSVIITGMHRTGTSATARVVDAFGLGTGSGPAMSAAPDNPRGFFERRDVSEFNDEWLERLGGAWWAPPATTRRTWMDLDEPVLREGRERCDLFDLDQPPWYSKDPRTALLLPLWDRLALRQHPVILCVRDPAEVAASLWLRNGLSPRRGLALWAAYTAAAVNQLGGRPALVVDYRALLATPTEVVAALEDFLRATGHEPGPGWNRRHAAELAERQLRRAIAPQWNEETLPHARQLIRLYGELTTCDARSPASMATIQLPDWVEEVLEELRELHVHQRRRAQADAEIQALRTAVQGESEAAARVRQHAEMQLESRRVERDSELDRLRAELHEMRARRDEATTQVAELRWQVVVSLHELARVAPALDAAQEALAEQAVRLDTVQAENHKRRTAMTEMSAELERRRARAHRAELLVAELRRQVAQLDEMAARVRERDEELRTVRFERDNLVCSMERILGRHTEAEATLDHLLASHAWRWGRVLTAPARLVRTSNGNGTRSVRLSAEEARDLAEIARSGLVDPDWYRSTYPDVAAAGMDPLDHFVIAGWREGRDPGPLFSVRYYLDHNPDVVEAGVNPLFHYLVYGWREGRCPRPDFDHGAPGRLSLLQQGVVPLVHEAARLRSSDQPS